MSIQVDLTGTTCIDSQGKQLLARMHKNGAKLIGTGLMTEFIIREIENGCVNSGQTTSCD